MHSLKIVAKVLIFITYLSCLNTWAGGRSFDESKYRMLIGQEVLPATEEKTSDFLRKLLVDKKGRSDERTAAVCYLISKRVPTNAPLSLKNQKYASSLVRSLWRQYPTSLELLNLRMRFSLFPDMKRAPFFEMAFPIAIAQKAPGQVQREIRNLFHLWLYNMSMNVSCAVDNNQKSMLSDRSLFLFGHSPSVTKNDMRIWTTVALDYAKRTPVFKDKWQLRAKKILACQARFSLKPMKLQEALDGLANQVTLNLGIDFSENFPYNRKELKKALQAEREKLRVLKQRQGNPLGLPKKVLNEKRKAENGILKPSDDWGKQKRLVDFYVRNMIVTEKHHPLFRFFTGKNACAASFLAEAYYQLKVHQVMATADKDQKYARIAELYSRKALNMEPKSYIAYAFLAAAKACQKRFAESESFLKRARAISPNSEEVVFAEKILALKRGALHP